MTLLDGRDLAADKGHLDAGVDENLLVAQRDHVGRASEIQDHLIARHSQGDVSELRRAWVNAATTTSEVVERDPLSVCRTFATGDVGELDLRAYGGTSIEVGLSLTPGFEFCPGCPNDFAGSGPNAVDRKPVSAPPALNAANRLAEVSG